MPFVYYNVAAGEKIARCLRTWQWQRIWKCVPAPQRPPARIAAPAKEVFLRSLMERGGGGRFTDSEVQAYKRDVKNIMIRMGLLSGEEVHTVQQKNVTRAEYLEAENRWIVVSGIFRRRYVRGRCGSGNGERYLGKPFTGVIGQTIRESFCTRRWVLA